MLLYDQMLGWGNSIVALSVNVCWMWLDMSGTGLAGVDSVSKYAGAVITLGLEAGSTSPGAELRIRASCSRLAHKLKGQAGSRPAEWCHLDRSILNAMTIMP